MNVAGALAFAVLLLIAGVTEAPAVAFNSVAGTAAICTRVQAGCADGVLQAIAPDPNWQRNNPGGGSTFLVPLGGLAHTIQFDVFQTGAFTFGLLYQGDPTGDLTSDLTPVPEPASLFLVGSALAVVGFIARRRLQKS